MGLDGAGLGIELGLDGCTWGWMDIGLGGHDGGWPWPCVGMRLDGHMPGAE